MISYILKYFPDLSDEQIKQFEIISRLYPEWNQKINVVSRKDIENLEVNHILHSLSIARLFTPVENTKFLDMGTGGGFPGIPLAIMFPECKFHLIDRIGKKIKVAETIANEAGLKNVTFQHGDIGECRAKFDFVVSRAVMTLDSLYPLVKKNIDPKNRNAIGNGLITLKGGDLSEEIANFKKGVMVYDLKEYFEEPFYETKKIVYTPLN